MSPKLKFKIDENLSPRLASRLRKKGYEACSVEEQGINGKDDSIVAKVCLQEKRTLITQDLGFGDIRNYPPELYSGIIS